MKVQKFKHVKIGNEGFKISFNFTHSSLHVFKGIVHEIEDFGEVIYDTDHAIILRSEEPCSEDHVEYMNSFGYNYVMINSKPYPLTFGCSLYSKTSKSCSFFAKDKTELKNLKQILKQKAVSYATRDFK